MWSEIAWTGGILLVGLVVALVFHHVDREQPPGPTIEIRGGDPLVRHSATLVYVMLYDATIVPMDLITALEAELRQLEVAALVLPIQGLATQPHAFRIVSVERPADARTVLNVEVIAPAPVSPEDGSHG